MKTVFIVDLAIVGKFKDQVDIVLGHLVNGVQGVEQGSELTTLRSASVERRGEGNATNSNELKSTSCKVQYDLNSHKWLNW